jgi:Zn-dependent peptidase ImmA (M78 family)/DNA-binding XRE family transcriptional regulator
MNPTRLTLARKRKGLTKTAFAEKIGVDRRAVNAYEAGEYPPSEETAERIQSVLGFPLEFFKGDDLDQPTLYTGSFRSASKMLAPHRDMALSQAAIGLYLNRWIESHFELPQCDLPDLSREPNPQAAAESLRRAWGIGQLSIRNMVHLLESRGVRVFSLAVDAREVDAFSMWNGTTPFVFLNTYKTAEHSRFDAAHELGHLVLHKHGPPQGMHAERQANSFASSFLMPEGSVRACGLRFATYDTLVQLKKNWIVSVSALAYRLHELKLLSDWQYRGICIEIAKRGRDKEPDPAPSENSLVLPKVMASLQAEGFTRSRIADALAIPRSELEQLLCGLTITSVDGGRGSATPAATQGRLRMVK